MMKRNRHAAAVNRMVEEIRAKQQAALPAGIRLTRVRDLAPGAVILDATLALYMTVERVEASRARHYVIITGRGADGAAVTTSRHLLDDVNVRVQG